MPAPWLLACIIWAEPQTLLIVTGVLFIVCGELMRVWGVSYAGGATRTRNVGASKLVTNAPFAYLKNPLYLGNILMYAGAAVLSAAWFPYLPVLVLIFFSIQYHFIVKLEEAKLTELFGAAYTEYAQKVPRFIPSFKTYDKQSEIIPDLKKAVRSERSTFLAMLSFIVIFSLRCYFI